MLSKFQGYLRKEICALVNPLLSANDGHSLMQKSLRTIGFSVGRCEDTDDPEIRGVSSRHFIQQREGFS